MTESSDPGMNPNPKPGSEQEAPTDDRNRDAGAPRDPMDTDHPAGESHAAENAENEPAG